MVIARFIFLPFTVTLAPMYRRFISRPQEKSPPALMAAATSTIGLVKKATASAPLALPPTRTSFPSGNRKKSELVLTLVADAIRVVEKVADSLPFLSVATGITLIIIDKILAISQNREECSAIVQRIAEVFLAIAETFRNVDQSDIPPRTFERICALQSRLNEFLRHVEKIAAASKCKRYFLSENVKSELRDLNSKFDDCLRFFQLSSTLAIQAQTERLSCTSQIADATAPGVPEMVRREFDLNDVLRSQSIFEVYEASCRGKVVSVKRFKGVNAKKNWARYLEHDSREIHPNVATVIGKSGALEPAPYIVYAGIEGCLEERLAKSLKSDVHVVVRSCVTFIYGLSAGLLHLHNQGIPLITLGADNIHVFLGTNSRTILSIDWPETVNVESNNLAPTSDKGLLNILDSLGTRVFQAANKFSPSEHDDSVQHDWTSKPQDTQRGLVWKTSNPNVLLSLHEVYTDARGLHNECRDLTWSPDHLDTSSKPSRKTRQEFTFSARVHEYAIINRNARISWSTRAKLLPPGLR